MTVEDKIQKLNAGWYNVVNQALGITDPNFQLAQGTLGLQTEDSSGLFLMADAVPPSAAVHYYDPGSLLKRSSAYGGLLNALQPEQASTLRQTLGDMYSNWIQYKSNYDWSDPAIKTQFDLFKAWANRALDPSKAAAGITVYKQNANNKLNKALDKLHGEAAQQTFIAPDGKAFSLYRYSATNSAAKTAVQNSGEVSISYDSSTADTSLKHTTADGSASGFYSIFSGGAGVSFDKLNTTAASSKITISGTIFQNGTLVVEPIDWFESYEYGRAYAGKGDATIWNPTANMGDWNAYFQQPDGQLARNVTQMILVSGYDITVTSHASYTSDDYQRITASASFGIWPFFSASASSTNTQHFTHNEDGTLSVTHRLDKGLIQIWGVISKNAPA